MSSMKSLAFTLAVMGVAWSPALACAQKPAHKPAPFFVVDSLAKAGETVWSAKGCLSCHTIGTPSVIAPDLADVFERRTVAWVRTFVLNPDSLLERDDTAKALLARYNFLRMPKLNLSEAEVDAVLHYIAAQSKPKKK